MNLYELKYNYLKLQELIENGELTADELADTIESINDDIDFKAENYAKIIKMQDYNVKMLKSEIERLTNKKKTLENNIDWLRENLKSCMIETNKTKIKTKLFNISISDNKESVEIINESEIPDEYFRIKKEVNKEAIKDDLIKGVEIKGVKLSKIGKKLVIR